MNRILRCTIVAGFTFTSIPLAIAQQAPPDWPAAVARYYARSKQCWARYSEKRLKTFTEATTCEDGGLVDALALAGYPYMDLVRVIVAEHLVIAERVDKKKITVAEGVAARAELESRMVAEIQRRDLAAQKTRVEAAEAYARTQAQSQADARSREMVEAQGRMLEQMQAQAAADADAARRAQALDLMGRFLSPQYTAPARTYPSQTVCQHVGFQVICNSD